MKKKKILFKKKDNCSIYTFYNEDHTLGNIIRFLIQTNPFVNYIGYNIPHPSENILNIKIISNKKDHLNYLILGLKNASEICIMVDSLFNKRIQIYKRISRKH